MKVLGVALFCTVVLGMPNCGFGLDVIDYNLHGAVNVFDDDVIILENVIVSPDKLVVDGFVVVENHGDIQTDIFVSDGSRLVLRNTGKINSVFNLGNMAVLYHKITNKDEMKAVDINANYTTFVESAETLSLTGVMDVANNSDKVYIQNTVINIDGIPCDTQKRVELGDSVTFVLGDITGIYDGVLLDDVRGVTQANFIINNQNSLFSNYGYIENNKLHVRHVRETDYTKIFNSNLGVFLNSTRAAGKYDSLFVNLDNAMSFTELDAIMQDSVLFNPDKLFESLYILNALNFADRDFEYENLGGEIFGFASDSFYAYGLGANFGFNLSEDLSVYAMFQMGTLDYKEYLDMFSGSIYGLNIGAKYLFYSDMFVHGDIGLLALDTDIDAVFYDNKEIKQPWAKSWYINTDVGRLFRFDDFLSLTPFAGFRADYYSVDTYNDSKANLYIGTDVGFDTEFSGIKYFYSARGAFNTDMYFMLNGKIGIWSVVDAMGGDLSASISNTGNVLSYKVALNTRIAF